MLQKRAVVLAGASGWLLLSAMQASAQAPKWAMDGAGCVPTDKAVKNGPYTVVAGRIKFDGTRTGQIVAMCPVSVGVGSVNAIGVSYLDSTGAGTTAAVVAALRRLRKSDGHVETVDQGVAQEFAFSSDKESATTFAHKFGRGSHTLDDFNFYYFVQVTLKRQSPSEIVEFGGVELTKVID